MEHKQYVIVHMQGHQHVIYGLAGLYADCLQVCDFSTAYKSRMQ